MNSLSTKLKGYSKFLVALAGAVAQVVATQFGNRHVVQVVLAVLAAAGVWAVPNKTA